MAKGVCQFCGCTDEKPCRYVPNPHGPIAGQKVITAKWVNKEKTLCDNPICLEKSTKDSQ